VWQLTISQCSGMQACFIFVISQDQIWDRWLYTVTLPSNCTLKPRQYLREGLNILHIPPNLMLHTLVNKQRKKEIQTDAMIVMNGDLREGDDLHCWGSKIAPQWQDRRNIGTAITVIPQIQGSSNRIHHSAMAVFFLLVACSVSVHW